MSTLTKVIVNQVDQEAANQTSKKEKQPWHNLNPKP
jgi:hypothetical protein